MNILAIDLGKFNSMACFYNSQTREHRFQLCKTERNYLTTLFKSEHFDLVVMEADWASAENGTRRLSDPLFVVSCRRLFHSFKPTRTATAWVQPVCYPAYQERYCQRHGILTTFTCS